jgi:hypothetical protein
VWFSDLVQKLIYNQIPVFFAQRMFRVFALRPRRSLLPVAVALRKAAEAAETAAVALTV